MEAIDALTKRVSGGVLVGPAPDELELHSILSAAVRAPDHGRLRPWRLIVLRGAARKRLGMLMGQVYRRRHPDATPAQIEKETNKPLRAPLIVVVFTSGLTLANVNDLYQPIAEGVLVILAVGLDQWIRRVKA